MCPSLEVVVSGEGEAADPVVQDTNALVAIKAVIRSKLTTKLLENLESEISILKRITHRNIVELKEIGRASCRERVS